MDVEEAAGRLVEIAIGAVAFEYMADETALRMGAAALREVEQLRARLDLLKTAVDARRCHDHSCIFGHPGGMGTNGGCQALKGSHPETRRDFQLFVKVVRAALDGYDNAR